MHKRLYAFSQEKDIKHPKTVKLWVAVSWLGNKNQIPVLGKSSTHLITKPSLQLPFWIFKILYYFSKPTEDTSSEQLSRELKIQKKHKEKYGMRVKDVLVVKGVFFFLIIWFLTQGFTVCVSRLARTCDPPTSAPPPAQCWLQTCTTKSKF